MNTPALGTAHAISLQGLEGTDVAIEATLLTGLPVFTMVGLADTAVIEAKERLRASFHNVGLGWPNQRLTVNLSPADTAKSGAGFDLGIAAAIIGALGYGQLPADTFLIGELGLDGAVRGVRGVLPALLAAQKLGFRQAFVPEENKHEAELVSGISVISIANLAVLAAKLRVPGKLIAISEAKTVLGSTRVVPGKSSASLGKSAALPSGSGAEESFGNLSQLAAPVKNPAGDISDVYGQEEVIWALQIAAIGGHHPDAGATGRGEEHVSRAVSHTLATFGGGRSDGGGSYSLALWSKNYGFAAVSPFHIAASHYFSSRFNRGWQWHAVAWGNYACPSGSALLR